MAGLIAEDDPSWMKQTRDGALILMCVKCIKDGVPTVYPAVTIQNGNAVCQFDIETEPVYQCSVPGHPEGRVSDDGKTFYCGGCETTHDIHV